jgi:hypothetical protein
MKREKCSILLFRIYDPKLVGGLNPSEKYESQLGVFFPNIRKNKIHVPNHQLVMLDHGYKLSHVC